MSIEPYLLFGRLCLKAKLFSAKELRKAVTKQFNDQKEGKKKLFGEVCVELGFITEKLCDEILKRQQSEEIHPEATVFGHLAVVNGFITKKQIAEALRTQKEMREKGDKKRIGEILYSEKLMAPIQVRSILKAQHRLRQGIHSTMYLNKEFTDKQNEKNRQKKVTDNAESIDADELEVVEPKNARKQKKADVKKSKNDKKIKTAQNEESKSLYEAVAENKTKKPSIDEIADRLKTLEEDFGGMFEVSIDEDDAVDIVDDAVRTGDEIIEPKQVDNELDENVFNIRKEEQQLRRTDQLKLHNVEQIESTVNDIKEKLKRGSEKTKEDEVYVSQHSTEYLADQIVFEPVQNEDEKSSITKQEQDFLDKNIRETLSSEIEIIKSDGTKITSPKKSKKPLSKLTKKKSSTRPKKALQIPKEMSTEASPEKKTAIYQERKKNLFKGRIGDNSNSLKVELKKSFPTVAVIMIIISLIMFGVTTYFFIQNM
ncbi:MAG: hypothetical protein K8S87_09260 [Planctomycetes bacterium]|nr:hypothetical protein [Planctomycetota bacterium]